MIPPFVRRLFVPQADTFVPVDAELELGPSPARAGSPAKRMVLGELNRIGLMARRYPVETAASVVALLSMFFLFAYLGQVDGGQWAPFTGSPRVLAILYAFWLAASATMGSSASAITDHAAVGLLESLFLGSQPVTRALEMQALAHLVRGTIIGATLVVVFCVATRWLPSPAVLVSIGVCLGACHVTTVGLTLMLSGATLMLKRLGPLLMLVNGLTMLAMVGGPRALPQPSEAGMVLPYVSAQFALRRAIESDTMSPALWAVAWIVAVACLLAGRAVLDACVTACRRSGSVQGY